MSKKNKHMAFKKTVEDQKYNNNTTYKKQDKDKKKSNHTDDKTQNEDKKNKHMGDKKQDEDPKKEKGMDDKTQVKDQKKNNYIGENEQDEDPKKKKCMDDKKQVKERKKNKHTGDKNKDEDPENNNSMDDNQEDEDSEKNNSLDDKNQVKVLKKNENKQTGAIPKTTEENLKRIPTPKEYEKWLHSLRGLLNDKNGVVWFKKYLNKHESIKYLIHYVDFYSDIQELKNKTKTEATVICTKYLKDKTAENFVSTGLEGDKVLKNLNMEDFFLVHTFDGCQDKIEDMLNWAYRKHLTRFKEFVEENCKELNPESHDNSDCLLQ